MPKSKRVIKKKEKKLRTVKAWIIGNVICFEKPQYKSPFFDTEEVLVTYSIIK